MTSQQWQTCNIPMDLVTAVKKVSKRKLRLFACGCARSMEHFQQYREAYLAVLAAEAYSAGQLTFDELSQNHDLARLTQDTAPVGDHPIFGMAMICCGTDAHSVARAAASCCDNKNVQADTACKIFRDIIGNPFEEVIFDQRVCPMCYGHGKTHIKEEPHVYVLIPRTKWCDHCQGKGRLTVERPEWATNKTVLDMALSIYNHRSFEDLPILADAMEESGCQDQAILHHCRNEFRCPGCTWDSENKWYSGGGGWCAFCDNSGPEVHWITARDAPLPERPGLNPVHVRGCWVLDLVLGKK